MLYPELIGLSFDFDGGQMRLDFVSYEDLAQLIGIYGKREGICMGRV